jgi:superfamily II DNA or RNA helicase
MRARDYQDEAADKTVAAWNGGDRLPLAVMATGLGKTFYAADVAARPRPNPRRVMFICHRTELIDQARPVFEDMFGEPPEIEQGDNRAGGTMFAGRVVLATIQTLYSGYGGKGRISRFDPKEFDRIIIDEFHHYVAPVFRKPIDYMLDGNPDLRGVGITATADRADGLAMGRLATSVVCNFDIRYGIDRGWLVPVDQWTGTLGELDLDNVDLTRAGDFNPDQLQEQLMKHGNLFAVVNHTLERVGDRKTLIFAAEVEHARALAAIINDRLPPLKAGVPRAQFIAASKKEKTPTEQRRAIIDAYKRGEFQFLVNVGIATEGFNVPGIECVVVARPTKSRSLYTQMAGRGTRTLPGVVDPYEDPGDRRVAIAESAKPCCELIDFVGNAGRHKLVSMADVLGGDYDTDVVARAKQKATDAADACDVRELLESSRLEIERERAARSAELARLRVASSCDFVQVDAFDTADDWKVNNNRKNEPSTRVSPASDSQKAFLDKWGPKDLDLDALTIGDAGRLIGEIKRRKRDGLCSIMVADVLMRHGLPADVPKETGGTWIERIKANDWRVPPDVRREATAYQLQTSGGRVGA